MPLFLFKQTLLWLNPVNTWTVCGHQGHRDISWYRVRKCLSRGGRCAEPQQESRPWDLLPVPLRQLRTSAWALGGLDLALGSSVCPTEPCAQVSSCWPHGSCPAAERHIHRCNGGGQGAEATCLAWLRALHQPHLASDAGWAATPSEWHTWRSPAYMTFSVLTVLGQGLSAAQWHDSHGEGQQLSLSPGMQNEHPWDQVMSLLRAFIAY